MMFFEVSDNFTLKYKLNEMLCKYWQLLQKNLSSCQWLWVHCLNAVVSMFTFWLRWYLSKSNLTIYSFQIVKICKYVHVPFQFQVASFLFNQISLLIEGPFFKCWSTQKYIFVCCNIFMTFFWARSKKINWKSRKNDSVEFCEIKIHNQKSNHEWI